MNSKKVNIKIKPIVGFDSIDATKIIFYQRNKKTHKKERVIINDFRWYFCIEKKDFDEKLFDKIIRYTKTPEESGEYIKIYCNKRDFPILSETLEKHNIKTYEADLSLTKRYMIDNLIEIEEKLDILFFDIETDDTQSGIVIGRDKILSWAACDNNTGKTFYFSSGNEKKVILSLLKLFNEYDVITGWNSTQFDIPYIIERIKANNIKTKDGISIDKYHFLWKKVMHVDMMRRFIKLFAATMTTINLPDFSLNEVSKVFLKEKKIERKEKIIDLFKNNKSKLKEYNIKDVKLLYDLNKKLKIIPLMIKECSWTGSFINRFYVSELLDNFILREAKKNNFRLKTKPPYNKELERIFIRGGYVMAPKVGLYKNVRIFDFKSLYPSIIIDWNISQMSLVSGKLSIKADDSLNRWLSGRKLEDVPFMEWFVFLKNENKKLNPDNKYIQAANNQFFLRDKKNAISVSIQKLLKERNKYKKLLDKTEYGTMEYENAYATQYAIKVLTNSLYGVTADQRTRFFDKRIAEAITTTGQLLNRATTHILENKLNIKVIYSDTDSMFFSLEKDDETKELLEKINKKLSNYLLKSYQIKNTIILIQYEKKFRKFLMLDKKKYAGHLINIDNTVVDSIFTKGTENVRRNIIKYTRKSVNDLLELILRKNKDEKFIIDWMQDRKKDIFEKNITSEDISITARLSKPIKEYKLKTPHVRLAEKMIANKEILDVSKAEGGSSQKIEYIIDNTREIDTDAIGAVETKNFSGDWNQEYYWDILISPPLIKILNISYPNVDWNKMFNSKEQKKIKKEAERKLKMLENEVKKEFKKIENEIIRNIKF